MSDKLPPKVLIIDSNEILRTSVCNTIERYWFSVCQAESEKEAISQLLNEQPNLVIVSSRMQGISAIEMANKIKANSPVEAIPIIFLIDSGEPTKNYKKAEDDLVECIKRPFTPNELMLAIKGLLRKSKPVFQDRYIKYKNISMDLATYRVFNHDIKIQVGPTEFKILQLMITSPNTIFSRQQIIDFAWGTNDNIDARTVDVHINRLRSIIKKAEKHTAVSEPFIKTVRAAGYCLSLPGENE